jgi:hypothetical protein
MYLTEGKLKLVMSLISTFFRERVLRAVATERNNEKGNELLRA